MKQHKICGRIISAMLALSLMLSFGVIYASANNHDDEGYSYSFTYAGQQDTTGYRTKEDNSSAYMYCTGGNGKYQAWVVANVAGTIVNCAYGNYYGFAAGQAKYMLNNVYENHGSRPTAIRGQSINGVNVYGVWSPDSV